ncbi:MAG: TIGR03960 family B12-binding radical SAM protein [Actinomycetia bacterium]|nr:TIGR03960 family B12-binding radical SAM protein [Actinomycetes bacterium]
MNADSSVPVASSLWPQIEPLLGRVEKPSRYIGQEFNSCTKTSADYRAVFVYPDTYEIGQSNQAIALLYTIVNQLDGLRAERAFLPWLDMDLALRQAGLPLFVLESATPLASFDLIGITLPHELAATNVLEVLDLAGLPLRSDQRDASYPLVIGGGPVCFNPEPLAPFFDALVIGEAEELIGELIATHRQWRRASRAEQLAALSALPGVYVPSLSCGENRPTVTRRVYTRFSEQLVLTPLVPYTEVVQDRFSLEVLRGCSRGCRFCQAGMTYRPVRERSADIIVQTASAGIAATGFDEVSLVSLSTTDHSGINGILRRLNDCFRQEAISISLPSQRLDAFGVEMARLVAGEKRGGLTFAPEAGSQRLRDVINKNVQEADLFTALQAAVAAGWRRVKLYFMIGLPTETDDDVLAIADLVQRVYSQTRASLPTTEQRQLRLAVSLAVFVPKAATPFQWCGQLPLPEVERRLDLLRQYRWPRGVEFSWHDPRVAQVEAALSRSDQAAADLVEQAWRHGALFAAWHDQFDYRQWQQAAADAGLDLAELAERDYSPTAALPWQHIVSGVSEDFLWSEWQRAQQAQTTADCSFTSCQDCGVCAGDIQIQLAGPRQLAGQAALYG